MSKPNIFHSRGPVIRREIVDLVRVISEDGLWSAPLAELRFKREIAWTREASATVTLNIGDRELKQFASFGDFRYGLFTCLEGTHDEARRLVERENLGAGHALTALVEVTVTDTARTPVREGSREDLDDRYGTPWADIPNDWFIDGHITAAWLRELQKPFSQRDFQVQPLRPASTSRSYVVFSSQNDETANAALLAAMKAAETPDAVT